MIVALGSTPACCLYSDYSNIKIFFFFFMKVLILKSYHQISEDRKFGPK